MAVPAFRVLKDSKLEERATVGTIVYACTRPDYGCAKDDTHHFGVEHASFTLKKNGGYPFFTMPLADVEKI